MRLLIVGDHALLVDTLALALRQDGLKVHSASGPTPEAVIEVARSLAPVLVLLDIELGPPLGNGVQLVRPLVDAGAQVVMVTAVTDPALLGACIEAGATGVISKGKGFLTLMETVQRAVDDMPLLREDERVAFLEALRDRRREDHERLAPFGALSPRERAVLMCLVAGEPAETIAESTYVSVATIRSHIRAILLKLGVNSQLAAVAMAHHAGWPPSPNSDSTFPANHQSW